MADAVSIFVIDLECYMQVRATPKALDPQPQLLGVPVSRLALSTPNHQIIQSNSVLALIQYD